MAGIEFDNDKSICFRCGTAYGRFKGNFLVSYSVLHKGRGYMPFCKNCVDSMYNKYLSECGNARDATRQMCRKLDLYWSDKIFESVEKKATTRTMMTNYIQRINTTGYAGKSYDDTLLNEGVLWTSIQKDRNTLNVGLNSIADNVSAESGVSSGGVKSMSDMPDDIIAYWGPGYTPEMYTELEQRRIYWMSQFPSDLNLDIGTEAIIRQICSLEIDINRDRVAGRSVEKSIIALNTLLGSANLKPVQKKQEDADLALSSTPLGVWLYRFENKRPLPEIDEDLKDVNKIRKYVFTWMGHLCKMLGVKNAYSKLYEEEIERLRVEKPEYDGDDDEAFLTEIMLDEPPGYESDGDSG